MTRGQAHSSSWACGGVSGGTAIGRVPLIVLVMEAGEGSHRIGDEQVDALAGVPGSGRQSSRSLGGKALDREGSARRAADGQQPVDVGTVEAAPEG